MSNRSYTGTYANLLAGLQTLTAEQLARPIEATTETHSFGEVSLQITTKDQFYQDGDWQGSASDLDADEQAGCDLRRPAGDVYIYLD